MGAQEESPAPANAMQRVKVYRLCEDGKWDDQGTGHVTVDYLERSEDLGLFVTDEEDNGTLLLHRISADDIYQKQEGTIISWRDPEYSTDLALSFQENAGCSFIWDHICSVRRNLHFSTLNSETFHSGSSDLKELPAVELSRLPLVLKVVTESGVTDQLRVTDLILHEPEFLQKLMDLFRVCEDLENIDSLHIINKIVKGIILLNSQQIFEKIFSDELIMDTIGSLEYDPDIPHVKHRNFLKEHVVFKEAIPIRDPIVLSKIHQTYRIGYLKDVMLPRVLDEAAITALNSMMHANNAMVVSLLKDDSAFIQELFARLRSSTTSVEPKKNLVYFLHEFCTLSKSLQMVHQLRLFRDFVNEGIFDIMTDVLQSKDKRLVLTGTDIIILIMNQDSNFLRSYIIRPEGVPLLGLLVQGMMTDFGDDMHCQFLEIIRSLLDTYTISGPQRDAVIEIFYEKHLGQLIDVITSSCPENDNARGKSANGKNLKHTSTKPEILLNICELLCFCVMHHPYRIKCDFIPSNVIEKVLFLIQRKEKYLVVAAVRFIRTIISRNDDNVSNYIVKHNLFKPILDAFVSNGDRYNLLNSAVLELLEYIRKENLKILLKYVVESFWNQLGKFEYLTPIEACKVKYEQSLESSVAKTSSDVDSRKRVDERALEKEEEDYFNGDSDEDTTSASPAHRAQAHPVLPNGSAMSGQSLRSRSGGLVDYDDDEDGEDYKPPPPRRQTDTSDNDEGTLESLSLRRKMATKGKESRLVKKQRFDKSSKPKDSVFAALCSTLSQAVLPGSKAAASTTVHNGLRGPVAGKGLEKEDSLEKEADDGKSGTEVCLSDHHGKEADDGNSRTEVCSSDHREKEADDGKSETEVCSSDHREKEADNSKSGTEVCSSDHRKEKEADNGKSVTEVSSSDHQEKENCLSPASSHVVDHHSADVRQFDGEESLMLPAQTSSDMAMNGS